MIGESVAYTRTRAHVHLQFKLDLRLVLSLQLLGVLSGVYPRFSAGLPPAYVCHAAQ